MSATPFLTYLMQSVPEEEARIVLPALRQDAIVWAGVQQLSAEKLAALPGSGWARWLPSNLAQVLLSPSDDGQPGESLPERARTACDTVLSGASLPATLDQAGLVALALQAHFEESGAWSPVLNLTGMTLDLSDASVTAVWRAALACLYGLAPDRISFLRALLGDRPSPAVIATTCHSLLANPASLEARVQMFGPAFEEVNRFWQPSVVLHLQAIGQMDLARELAGRVVSGEDAPAYQPANGDTFDLHETVLRAAQCQIGATLFQVAGHAEPAQERLAIARASYEQSLAFLILQENILTGRAADEKLDPALLNLSMQAAAALNGWTPAASTGSAAPLHPLAELSAALQELGEHERARQAASNLAILVASGRFPASVLPFDWQPAGLVTALVHKGLPHEARDLAAAILGIRPADGELLEAACLAEEACGDYPAAIQSARLTTALAGDREAPTRRLITLLERAGEWQAAFVEQERLVATQVAPILEDRLALGRLALSSGQLERARQISEDLLQSDPDCGGVHLLAGQTARAVGNGDEAALNFSRATLLAPELDQPWLALAEMQKERGAAGRSLETLREAVLAAPESAGLQLALGQACLEQNCPSEALPYLWESYRLDANQPQTCGVLASTLYRLGHAREAAQVVETARQRWPSDALLAGVDARLRLDDGEQERALPALETALSGDCQDAALYAQYARALFRADTRQGLLLREDLTAESIAKARPALERAVALASDDFEARLLLAEIAVAEKDENGAFARYQQLADCPEASLMQWRWRVQAGLGLTALHSGATATAVSALREAAGMRPDALIIQQQLADAYQMAGLPDEAAMAARMALQVAPHSLPVLTWYIERMERLNRDADVITALIAAVQIMPAQPGAWNRLAFLQARTGDNTAARGALLALSELTGLTIEDYRQAAGTYLMIGDHPAALATLQQALDGCAVEPPVTLLFETAALQAQLGQADLALANLSRARALEPGRIEAHLLASDLFASLGQDEQAQLALQQAEEIECTLVAPALEPVAGCLPAGWLASARSASAVATRRALQELASGKPAEALQQAEAGLQAEPDNLALRCLAVQIARGQLLPARAGALVHLPDGAIGTESAQSLTWEQALVAEQVEMALEAGEVAQAARLVESGLPDLPEEAHLLAIQARLLAHMGDLRGAVEALQAGFQAFAAATAPAAPVIGPDVARIYAESAQASLAEAALDLGRYQDAATLFTRFVERHPADARAALRLARGLVLAAERQQTCTALQCSAHAPGEEFLQPAVYQQFQQAIENAAHLSSSPDVAAWQARGEAVFHPALKNAPALAKLAPSSENAAALLSTLRLAKNAANAVRLVHHYPESPELLLQLALCYREVDPLKGVEAARKAIEKAPDQPLYYAGLAAAAEKICDFPGAQAALEEALMRWPEESGWHAWAANLYHTSGKDGDAVSHYEKALALQPNATPYALALGQIYLDNHDSARAVEVLEHASRVDPQNKSVWMALAEAYEYATQFPEALECAHLASQLDTQDPAPLLLRGKIALQTGKLDLAYEQAAAAQALKSDLPEAVLFMARVMVQRGSLVDGLEVLEKALPALRASLAVQMERGNLIRRLYGAPAALPVLTELAQLFPHEAGVLAMLAQAQAECGDLKSAERSAYAAHHLNPELPEINYLLGRLQHSAGQLDQAIHFLSEAIQQSPSDIDSYLELGDAYIERREHAQALHTYQQAIRVAPKDFRPFYRAALLLRDNKDYLGAESMLRKAADLSPDDLNIRRQLGAVVALNLVHNSQEVNSIL